MLITAQEKIENFIETMKDNTFNIDTNLVDNFFEEKRLFNWKDLMLISGIIHTGKQFG